MRNNNSSKYLLVAALLVSVAALSIGFAAMTSTLTIQSSAAYTGDPSNFDVDFSTSQTSYVGGSVTPTVTPTEVPTPTATPVQPSIDFDK